VLEEEGGEDKQSTAARVLDPADALGYQDVAEASRRTFSVSAEYRYRDEEARATVLVVVHADGRYQVSVVYDDGRRLSRTLPVDDSAAGANLTVTLTSPEGGQRLSESRHRESYFHVMPHFSVQDRLFWCAPASMVMV
jgi:hypothetical protein